MKNSLKKIADRWYLFIICGFLLFALLVFGIFGESSLISVHDNLDLFVAQFQMMKNTNTFFAHGAVAPFLGGISRDNLPSEFSLYTMLYILLPSYAAYVTGYLLKILVAIFSSILLAKDVCKEKYEEVKPLVYMMGFAYGILNVFPAFGIPFASIPLAIYLFRKVEREPSIKWYVALFFYPFLTYFSYFGLFILAYMALGLIILWIRDRKFPLRIFLALVVLSIGSILFEYRLFFVMLFGDEVTIRSTMEAGSFALPEVIQTMGDGLVNGMFHAESLHKYLVLPVCVIYFLYLNYQYLKKKQAKQAFGDLFNVLVIGLLFNSFIYGIYYFEPFRKLIETIVPPLTGWQFNRTIFFNPFLWYALFFLVLTRLYQEKKKYLKYLANILSVLAVLIIILSGTRYNDLYHTSLAKAYELIKGKQSNDLSFEEFYSTDLFEQAKKDLHYENEWSVAYGFHPAILEYNGISTLDGYLGFYSQEYKEKFRKMIAPALDRVPESAAYFDTWGARAYLYSGTDLSIVQAVRDYNVSDTALYIDTDAFKKLGGRFIFSRIELSNTREIGLKLVGVYKDEKSPYTLYVYEPISLYVAQDLSDLSFDEMKNLDYDQTLFAQTIEEMKELVNRLSEEKEAGESQILFEGRMLELYEILLDQMNRVKTSAAMAEIRYYQNVDDQKEGLNSQKISKDAMEMADQAYSTLSLVCKSAYGDCLEEVLDKEEREALELYEPLSEEEKALRLTENELIQEYERKLLEVSGTETSIEESNTILGEIYLKLVEIRQKIAKLNHYDNYAEYAYGEIYLKDYSIDDARGLFQQVKENASGILSQIADLYYETNVTPVLTLDVGTADGRLQKVRAHLPDISEDMANTFDYMKAHHLYDMDAAPGKTDIGYTVQLPFFHAAFIFDSPYGNYQDMITAIHEFGHYNYMIHGNDNPMFSYNNIDLWEIHSQGLEVLYYDYANDLVGEEAGNAFRLLDIYQMAEDVSMAALNSEFEYQVYEHPEMTLTDMNKLYYNLYRQYGYVVDPSLEENGSWVNIPHLFSSPCYYLGYGTSALSSLDLFTLSREDQKKAIKTYLELTMVESETPYQEAIKKVGLRNIFEKGEVKKILQDTLDILKEDAS